MVKMLFLKETNNGLAERAMDAVVFKTDPDHECMICSESWVEESRATRRVCANDRCPRVVHETCLARCKNPNQCCQCQSKMGAWRSKPLLHPASASVDENELYAPAPLLVMMHSSPAYTSCTAVSAAVCATPFVPSSRTRGRISSWRWSASSTCSVRRNARQYVRTCPHVPACVNTARVPFTPMWHGRLLALHPCKSRSNEQTCA
jgi:hypothetical protein